MGEGISTDKACPAPISQLLCLVGLAACCIGSSGSEPRDPPAGLPTAVDPRPCLHPAPCDPRAKYRRHDASCNNLDVPTWGMSESPYARVLRSQYSDGIWAPRKAKDGSELPNARLLRTTLLPDKELDAPRHTLLLMQWGQLISHDTALGSSLRNSDGTQIECCSENGHLLPEKDISPACIAIQLPENDTFFGNFERRCMNIVRTKNTHSNGCTKSAGEQISTVNHLLDASFLYGNNKEEADSLRTFNGGLLKVQKMGSKEFLPNTDEPKRQCFLPSKSENICYKAGDIRVNMVPQLAALQVLFVRIHNRLSHDLSLLNPDWSDEVLYQEARRIVIGQYQHIIYNEFLPIVLGQKYVVQHFLFPVKKGLVDLYDKDLNPASLNSFVSSAYRGLHSLIQGNIQMINTKRELLREIKLSNWMERPSIVQESEQNYDSLLFGLVTQPVQRFDNHFTNQVTNFLFRGPKDFGVDLISIDITRNRDYGLASYSEFLKLCGMRNIQDFQDLSDVMENKHIEKLKAMYSHHDDIDLTVGGILERIETGALVGPTFQCLIGEQFRRWKMGDRFFYEFGKFPQSFTSDQINEIKKSTFARLLCDHGNNITHMQPMAFQIPSEMNPLTSCNSSLIPSPDLTPWKERK